MHECNTTHAAVSWRGVTSRVRVRAQVRVDADADARETAPEERGAGSPVAHTRRLRHRREEGLLPSHRRLRRRHERVGRREHRARLPHVDVWRTGTSRPLPSFHTRVVCPSVLAATGTRGVTEFRPVRAVMGEMCDCVTANFILSFALLHMSRSLSSTDVQMVSVSTACFYLICTPTSS